MYTVWDSMGNFLRNFPTYQAAVEFRGPWYDWTITKPTVLRVYKNS